MKKYICILVALVAVLSAGAAVGDCLKKSGTTTVLDPVVDKFVTSTEIYSTAYSDAIEKVKAECMKSDSNYKNDKKMKDCIENVIAAEKIVSKYDDVVSKSGDLYQTDCNYDGIFNNNEIKVTDTRE